MQGGVLQQSLQYQRVLLLMRASYHSPEQKTEHLFRFSLILAKKDRLHPKSGRGDCKTGEATVRVRLGSHITHSIRNKEPSLG